MRMTLVSFAFVLFSGALAVHAQTPRDKAIIIKRMIEKNHYSPRPVDDSFSVAVFKNMINTADPRRLFFTDPEYKQLTGYSTKMDDELNGKSWAFLDLFTELYKKALLRADSILNKLLQQPLDFSTKQTIGSSRKESFNFSADRTALTDRWYRYLKFRVLQEVYDRVMSGNTQKLSFKETLAGEEKTGREKIVSSEIRQIQKLIAYPGGYANLVSSIYFNAIASSFDPHTNYFSPQGKESFQAQLSTESLSFGMDLGENDKGEIIIKRLAPGGPAWKSGELHKADRLLSLQWEGKEAVEMEAATVETAYEILNESDHDRLVFRFRKADGTIKVVLLRKEKIDNEENIVKGFVLKGEKKIGYILLPGFYTEWENETGSSCANDVAKEIVRLKREKIDGLILDVRFNGGGSIGEAIDMIGIFINEGPLAADKSRNGRLQTYKDPNRGTIYDGPLALMVNGQSASASEMLAAALQDYNRAVIIGSNTFGKASLQQVFLLDTTRLRTYTGVEDRDVIKITMKKLYRLNGTTAQLNGVRPDIVLPDAFDGLEYRERSLPNVLPADTVSPNEYYKPLPLLPLNELSRRSTSRLKASREFQEIEADIVQQRKTMEPDLLTIPLQPEAFENWSKGFGKMPGQSQAGVMGTAIFTVENHAQDRQLIQFDPDAKELNDTWLSNLSGDIYLQEAFLVLNDLILLNTSTSKK